MKKLGAVRAFDDADPVLLKKTPASFDGEDEAGRLARRARNWIGDVTIAAG